MTGGCKAWNHLMCHVCLFVIYYIDRFFVLLKVLQGILEAHSLICIKFHVLIVAKQTWPLYVGLLILLLSYVDVSMV